MTHRPLQIGLWTLAVLVAISPLAYGDDKKDDSAEKAKQANQAELFKALAKTLTKARLIGKFTILGREDGKLIEEQYTIHSARKLPEGDLWELNAQIKYGKTDITVPLPLEIKWAGDTPVITLTNFTIPGLGTFSSRVVIYNNKYAGTWTHGKVGGHMFGTIEKIESKKEENKKGK